jgi:hypothetical protein
MLRCLAQLHHLFPQVFVCMIQELLFFAHTILPPLEIEEACLRATRGLVVLALIGQFLNRIILMLVYFNACVLFLSFHIRLLVISMRSALF